MTVGFLLFGAYNSSSTHPLPIIFVLSWVVGGLLSSLGALHSYCRSLQDKIYSLSKRCGELEEKNFAGRTPPVNLPNN